MNPQPSEKRQFFTFLKDIALVGAFAAGFILILVVASADYSSYASSLSLKENILKTSSSPRILIIGGSGASSSIDSATIKEKTGYNPVNLGIYAGVGMRFVLNQARESMKKGDIILLAPEYELLQQPNYGDGHLLLELLHENPTYIFKVLTPHSIIVMTRAFPGWLQLQVSELWTHIKRKLYPKEKNFIEKLYTIDNVNKFGDLDTSVVKNTHLSTAEILKDAKFVRDHIDPRNLTLIKDFFSEARSKGVKPFIVLPAVPALIKGDNDVAVTSQYAELVSTVGMESIIGYPGYFVFANDLFLDSLGHLTSPGKKERTEKILKLLSPRLRY